MPSESPPASPPPYIAIVTGANSGIGYSICQRLLFQLSQKCPPDARINVSVGYPLQTSNSVKSNVSNPLRSLHLIMACRNLEKAKVAKSKLLRWFENLVQATPQKDGLKSELIAFRERLEVQVMPLDLASVQSTFQFCQQVTDKYPHITHLFLNAGILNVLSIDGRIATRQILTEIVVSVSIPRFNIESVGDLTQDGLGHSWQSNCFGHYIIVRQLDALLKKSPFVPARVIWLSTRGAAPNLYDPDDWQLTRTTVPYYSSKRQIDVISWHLNHQLQAATPGDGTIPHIRHFSVEPGVASTNIFPVNLLSEIFKIILFFICRMLGSPLFTMSAYKAATAPTYAALAPMESFPAASEPYKLSSMTNRWGREGAMLFEIEGLQQTWEEDVALLEKYERLYQVFAKTQGPLPAGGDEKI